MEKEKFNLQEWVEETTSGFDNYPDFARATHNNKMFIVYHNTTKEGLDNIIANGGLGSKEYFQTMVYGRGTYACMHFNDACSARGKQYVVSFAVKPGVCDRSLIFSKHIREKLLSLGFLTKNETFEQCCKRLFSQEQLKELENLGIDIYRISNNIERGSNEGSFLVDALHRGRGKHIKIKSGGTYAPETILDEAGIEATFYAAYGDMIVARSGDVLTPYQYWDLHTTRDKHKPTGYCLKGPKDFDNVNNTYDAYFRQRKDYPDTDFQSKTIAGWNIIRKGNKYNIVNASTGKLFSPMNFDSCSVSPDGEITFKIGSETFEAHTSEYGRNIEVVYLQPDENGSFEEIPMPYDDFVSTIRFMQGGENEQLNESVDEVFTNKSEEDFNKEIDADLSTNDMGQWKNIYVYAATAPENVDSIMKSSLNAQYLGTNKKDPGIFHGIGGYTCYTFDDAKAKVYNYGGAIIRYMLKNGFKDFIMLDDKMRNKYHPNKTILDQMKELVPRDVLQQAENDFRRKGFSLDRWFGSDTESGRRSNSGLSDSQRLNNFVSALWGKKVGNLNYGEQHEETLLAKTKIRGYLVSGNNQKRSCVVRDFGSLIPIAYSLDKGNTWIKNPYLHGNDFKNHNERVNPFFLYRGEYEGIPLDRQQNDGYTLVNGKKGYNYKNIWNHKHLLPVDADSASPFAGGEATFTLAGETFTLNVGEDGKNVILSINGEQINYDDFIGFINMLKDEGALSQDKQIYTDSTLSQSNYLNENQANNKGRSSIRSKMEDIKDVHDFLVEHGEDGIFSDMVIENWGFAIEFCEKNRKQRSDFECDDDNFKSGDAMKYFESRIENITPLPFTIIDEKLNSLKKQFGSGLYEKMLKKLKGFQIHINNCLKTKFPQNGLNETNTELFNQINEKVAQFNLSYRMGSYGIRPVAYFDGASVLLPCMSITDKNPNGDYSIIDGKPSFNKEIVGLFRKLKDEISKLVQTTDMVRGKVSLPHPKSGFIGVYYLSFNVG